MSNEEAMTFRVESDLRASFSEAAEREHRHAAQVLRDFMRQYVEQSRTRAANHSLISDIERTQREEAVKYARASVGLEGFTVSAYAEQQAQRYINGELELAEFVKGYQPPALDTTPPAFTYEQTLKYEVARDLLNGKIATLSAQLGAERAKTAPDVARIKALKEQMLEIGGQIDDLDVTNEAALDAAIAANRKTPQ